MSWCVCVYKSEIPTSVYTKLTNFTNAKSINITHFTLTSEEMHVIAVHPVYV